MPISVTSGALAECYEILRAAARRAADAATKTPDAPPVAGANEQAAPIAREVEGEQPETGGSHVALLHRTR